MKKLFLLPLTVFLCVWVNAHADSYDAVIDFATPVELSLPVSGVVSTVNVSAGQKLKQGEILIALDDIPFRADRDLMQSQLAFQQTRLDEATRDLNHQQELYDRTVLSTVDLENAQLRVKRNTAMLESARAKLAMANYAYSNSRLKAPFDALVMAVYVNEGQSINNVIQSKPLVSVVRQGNFIARFIVKPEQLGGLTVGKTVTVNVEGTQYPAQITAIMYESSEHSKSTGTGAESRFLVTTGFSTASHAFPVGKKASVIID